MAAQPQPGVVDESVPAPVSADVVVPSPLVSVAPWSVVVPVPFPEPKPTIGTTTVCSASTTGVARIEGSSRKTGGRKGRERGTPQKGGRTGAHVADLAPLHLDPVEDRPDLPQRLEEAQARWGLQEQVAHLPGERHGHPFLLDRTVKAAASAEVLEEAQVLPGLGPVPFSALSVAQALTTSPRLAGQSESFPSGGVKDAPGQTRAGAIDGAVGEGGGQVIRFSITMSMLSGSSRHVHGIKAGRRKPGLMRQHLTAIETAVAAIKAAVNV